MLFDSDINVYGDSDVYIPEFDFKTRATRVVDKKQKFAREQNEKRRILRKNLENEKKKKFKNIEAAPESIRKKEGEEGFNFKNQTDSIGYTPVQKLAPTFGFKTQLEGLGNVTDITEHDQNLKAHEERKFQRMQTTMQNQTGQNLNESSYMTLNTQNT